MSLEYFVFRCSSTLFKVIYDVDNYLKISKVVNFCFFQVRKCKKKIKNNLKDDRISLSSVQYRFTSPLRKNKIEPEIINVSEHNISKIWKNYEREFGEKPKIGDSVKINYFVPFRYEKPYSHIDHKMYSVSYTYPSNIHYPPYTLEEIEKNKNKNEILFASCGSEDITEKASELFGPLCNFYSDLPSRYGVRITRDLFVPDTNKSEVIITDSNTDEYKFENGKLVKESLI